jgi:hypothetical protein
MAGIAGDAGLSAGVSSALYVAAGLSTLGAITSVIRE